MAGLAALTGPKQPCRLTRLPRCDLPGVVTAADKAAVTSWQVACLQTTWGHYVPTEVNGRGEGSDVPHT